MPLDDTVGEGPHTRAHRVSDKGHHRGNIPWVAASIRANQNLENIYQLKRWAGPLDNLLVCYKHVVALDPAISRCSRQRFEQYIYCMAQAEEELDLEDDTTDIGVMRAPDMDGGSGALASAIAHAESADFLLNK